MRDPERIIEAWNKINPQNPMSPEELKDAIFRLHVMTHTYSGKVGHRLAALSRPQPSKPEQIEGTEIITVNGKTYYYNPSSIYAVKKEYTVDWQVAYKRPDVTFDELMRDGGEK